jgi:hypothetical protein
MKIDTTISQGRTSKLPSTYLEGKKILPSGVTLTNDVTGYYLSREDRKIKKVKIKEGTYFNISEFQDDSFKNNSEILKDKNLVDTDLIATFRIEKGQKVPENTFFIYEDLIENTQLPINKMLRETQDDKAVLFYGIPKTYIFVGIGAILIYLGYKLYKKPAK